MVYGVIYKITNLINSKVYVGQTIQTPPTKRFVKHCNPVSARSQCMPVAKAIAKYGKENFVFEVVATCQSKQELNQQEAIYIKLFSSNDKRFGYNIGKIIDHRVEVSKATRNKLRHSGLKSRGRKLMKPSSQFIGVVARNDYASGTVWRARLGLDNGKLSLGTFKTEIEAAKAYDSAASKYYGRNCRLNFPETTAC